MVIALRCAGGGGTYYTRRFNSLISWFTPAMPHAFSDVWGFFFINFSFATITLDWLGIDYLGTNRDALAETRRTFALF